MCTRVTYLGIRYEEGEGRPVGMDVIWMPVLEQSCMERQRDGEPDLGPGPDKVGANKRHRRISVRGGGIRTKLPKTSCAFLLHHEGGRLLSSDCVPNGVHLTHH